MSKLDLSKYGITDVKEILHNPSYEELFKAETDPAVATQNARNLLVNKGVNAVCLNIIDETNPFGSDTNRIDFITADRIIALPKNDKLAISLSLLDEAANV